MKMVWTTIINNFCHNIEIIIIGYFEIIYISMFNLFLENYHKSHWQGDRWCMREVHDIL